MGRILGLGRGKRAARQALTGFNYLQDNPLLQQTQELGGDALGFLGGALGLGDPSAVTEAFETFRQNPGYQARLRAGQEAVTGSAAARGMLRSGDTLAALQQQGQELADQEYQSFLGQLQGLVGGGQQAALATGAAGSSGGAAAAAAQPQNQGILGRFFGI